MVRYKRYPKKFKKSFGSRKPRSISSRVMSNLKTNQVNYLFKKIQGRIDSRRANSDAKKLIKSKSRMEAKALRKSQGRTIGGYTGRLFSSVKSRIQNRPSRVESKGYTRYAKLKASPLPVSSPKASYSDNVKLMVD